MDESAQFSALIDRLVDAQMWSQLGEVLEQASITEDDARAGALVLRVMAKGQLKRICQVFGIHAHRRGPALVRLLSADAAVRSGTMWVAQIDELMSDLRTSLPPGWVLWIRALRLESFLWRGDWQGISATVLDVPRVSELPAPSELDQVGRMGRARLLRMRTFAESFVNPTTAAESIAACTAASELQDLGCDAARHLTDALLAYALWAADPSLTDPAVLQLEAAGKALEDVRADCTALVFTLLAYVATASRDATTAGGALESVRTTDAESRMTTPTVGCVQSDVLKAITRAIDQGPTPATVLAVHERVAAAPPSLLCAGLHSLTTGLLLDVGATAEARAVWNKRERAALGSSRRARDDLIRCRLDFLESVDRDTLAALLSALAQQPSMHPREARADLTRVAGDCQRKGFEAESADLRAQADTLLERHNAERGSGAPEGDGHATAIGDARSAGGAVRVLGPDLVVERHGNEVTVSRTAALLLAKLVAARSLVPTDRLCQTLWPGVDYDTARERLSSLLWRIRNTLELDRDDLLIRTDAGLELDPGPDWSIDAWEFADQARAKGRERFTALSLYGGDLCYRQLAYVDCLDAPRSQLHDLFTSLVEDVLESDNDRRHALYVLRRFEILPDKRLNDLLATSDPLTGADPASATIPGGEAGVC